MVITSSSVPTPEWLNRPVKPEPEVDEEVDEG